MPDAEARRGSLEKLLARARAVLVFEHLWPVAVAVLSIVAVFLAVSGLGLWLALPRSLRVLGVLLFAAGLVAVTARALRGRLPGRRDALARLDRDSGAPHRPISSGQDILADTGADAVTRALWILHRKRLDEALARVTLRSPSPRMVERDRYALRAGALLLLVAAAFVAGPDREGRLVAAFDWGAAAPPGVGFRLDSWIDPPAYTGRPPVVLSGAGAPVQASPGRAARAIAAPVGSTIVVRASGEGRVEVTAEGGIKAALVDKDAAVAEPASAARPVAPPAEPEHRFVLAGDGHLLVKRDGTPVATYDLDAIPDEVPTIALDGRPIRNARGSLTLRYTIGDDYGVVGAEALLSAPVVNGKPVTGRTLVEPPKLPLALPAAARGLGKGETTADLADSPWAGATVTLVLTARDEGGNTGRSAPSSLVLPARSFTQPLARALVEQRRDLVLDPDHHDSVGTALDALTLAPDVFAIPPAVFLGLRSAKTRLDAAHSDPELVAVADLLWAMALQIEDGDLSKTEQDLKALQQQLKDALARNAPPEEIRKLTEALRQQLDKFLAEMAQRADPSDRADRQNPDAKTRSITPQQLQAMIDRMEQAAKNGDMAEAQRMLDQLRGVLDNLKTAKRRSGAQQQAQRQMNQAMSDLDKMTRDQQALRDQTFKEGRDGRKADRNSESDDPEMGDGQDGDQAQGPEGQGDQAQGEQGPQGQGGQGQKGGQSGSGAAGKGTSGELQNRQNALRSKLGQLQKQMRDMGLEGEKGFDAAGKAMQDAENALGEGAGGNDRAVEAQGRALRGLQQGAQGLQKQMAQQGQGQSGEGQGSQDAQDGQGEDDGTGGPNGQQTDPLGRPRSTRGQTTGTNDDLRGIPPGAGARASQVLEELRRRLGDPSRPQVEQDYLERLLKRY
ncbi:MAG: TIGR02302 family protein [Janthinobacterium lividum]